MAFVFYSCSNSVIYSNMVIQDDEDLILFNQIEIRTPKRMHGPWVDAICIDKKDSSERFCLHEVVETDNTTRTFFTAADLHGILGEPDMNRCLRHSSKVVNVGAFRELLFNLDKDNYITKKDVITVYFINCDDEEIDFETSLDLFLIKGDKRQLFCKKNQGSSLCQKIIF